MYTKKQLERVLYDAGFLVELTASHSESNYLVSTEVLSRSEARRAVATLEAAGYEASEADHEHRPAMCWLWVRTRPKNTRVAAHERLTGRAAYDYALRHGFRLHKFADPDSGPTEYDTRSHDDLYEARLVLGIDPGLLWVEVRA